MSDNTLKTQAKRKAIKTSDASEDKLEKQMAPALKKPKKNKSSGLSTEVLCDIFVLLNRTKLIHLSRVNRQFFHAIKRNLSSNCLLIRHLFENYHFTCSVTCRRMFHTSHCWYVCNTLKIKVPVLEQKYVRFETTKLNLRGSKNSCLAFVRRLLPLKHLWKEQTLEVAFEKRMDSDFYDEMLQILVSPNSGPKNFILKRQAVIRASPPLPLFPVLAACPNVILTNISCNPTEVVDHLHCGELQTLRIILDCCWSEDEANLMRYLIKEKFQAAIVPQSFVLAISSFQRKETKDFENLENIQTGESLAMTRADVYLKIRRTKLVVAKDKMKAKNKLL